MTAIFQKRKQFIEDNFYEGQSDNELDKQKFELLKDPEELHYLAGKHNWDDGLKVLQWIAESKNCCEATALEIFWLAQPQDFQSYQLTKNLKNNYENDAFTLIKTIYQNYQNGFYCKAEIHFDPVDFIKTEDQIPDIMKEITKGETTYIYLYENDVESWFGEFLENKIKRSDPLELFNIAFFTKTPKLAKLILAHPLCDKGIAVLLFWQLKTFGSIWNETSSLMNEIISKVSNNVYPEILSYNPKTHKEIRMEEPKLKWIIPEIMKQAV